MMGQLKIVVMDRGHVLVGLVRPHSQEALSLLLDHAAVVRRWGTDHGLGQLAREGPLPNTILEPLGDGVEIGKMWVYFTVPCDPEAWEKWTSTASMPTARKTPASPQPRSAR